MRAADSRLRFKRQQFAIATLQQVQPWISFRQYNGQTDKTVSSGQYLTDEMYWYNTSNNQYQGSIYSSLSTEPYIITLPINPIRITDICGLVSNSITTYINVDAAFQSNVPCGCNVLE